MDIAPNELNEQLAAAGFTAYTMTGGMLDWSDGGLPAD